MVKILLEGDYEFINAAPVRFPPWGGEGWGFCDMLPPLITRKSLV
jgi:hypothetical protein